MNKVGVAFEMCIESGMASNSHARPKQYKCGAIVFGSMSAKQRKGDPVGHHLEEHGNVLEERQSTAKNGREEHPHDLEERGNVLEERQCAVKTGLEEHHPVWDFKNLKAGRGLV